MATPEEMKNLENNAKLRDLGIEWSDRIFKEFMEEAGKDYKAEERAMFYMTLGGDLLARMYGDVEKDLGARYGAKAGTQVAQRLLETSFSLVSMLVRRHGSQVQASVRVNFEEIANAAGKKEEPACDHAAAKECKCKLDQDGRCGECSDLFRTFFSKMGKAIQVLKSSDLMGTEFCLPCIPRTMDAALARVIREELGDLPPEMSEAVISALFMTSQNVQALPMPLTRKAWGDLQK